ncbi:MAG: hypothetical protein IJC30_04690, partial [Alphaproteobacteria bacterium]|nr:hypothetical protein [Alphaproteobacteria bacterium]
GEDEYCADKDVVCCKTGQVLCDGKCQDKPTPDASKCEKLSDDECEIVSNCAEGQTCDDAGNCVKASACDEGQKVCGTGENTWCCLSDNECGTGTGICCNADKTKCCYSFEPYIFQTKTCEGSFVYEQTLEPTGSYDCCQCAGNQIWDARAEKCVDCPSGSVKAGCEYCGLEKTFEYGDGYIDNYCYTFSANEHVSCAKVDCAVCPKDETYYNTVGESLNTLEDFAGCCKQAPKMCDYSGYSMKVCGEDC